METYENQRKVNVKHCFDQSYSTLTVGQFLQQGNMDYLNLPPASLTLYFNMKTKCHICKTGFIKVCKIL
jgi:hypothetical protein